MAKVLIGWEFGAGRGHLAVVGPVARRLVALGHEVVLALREAPEPGQADLGVCAIVAAPGDPAEGTEPLMPVHTLADVLAGLGLGDPDRLRARVGLWSEMLDAHRPHAVLCEFAPGLALAAAGRAPVVTAGVGYICPPCAGGLPPVRFWSRDVPPESHAAEAALVRAMQALRPGSDPDLGALLHGDAQVVCTWPELDPYAASRAAPAAGPPERSAVPAPDPERRGQAVFYLAADARLPAVIDAIAMSDLPARGFVRGLDAAGRRALARPGLELHPTPLPLTEVLATCPVFIHHGGVGAAEAALIAGTPQIVLARHLEQVVNGVALERRLGVGKAFSADIAVDRPAVLTDFCRRMARSGVVRGRAETLARALRDRPGPSAADVVAEALVARL